MSAPVIKSYSENTDQANCMVVYMDNIAIWYSYKTPVAFKVLGKPLDVRQNDWSTTTGKHLNWIDGGNKKDRIPGAEFVKLLADATK